MHCANANISSVIASTGGPSHNAVPHYLKDMNSVGLGWIKLDLVGSGVDGLDRNFIKQF